MTWSRYDLSGTLYEFTFIVGGLDLGICEGKKTSSRIQSVDLSTRIEVIIIIIIHFVCIALFRAFKDALPNQW